MIRSIFDGEPCYVSNYLAADDLRKYDPVHISTDYMLRHGAGHDDLHVGIAAHDVAKGHTVTVVLNRNIIAATVFAEHHTNEPPTAGRVT